MLAGALRRRAAEMGWHADHNAARDGPDSQNRAGVPDFRAHLLGRIAWVASVNPGRGAKLRQRFARISWE